MRNLTPIALAALSIPAALSAQQTRVDFPSSQLSSPAELLFPFYTIQPGNLVRYQTVCPSTFAGLPNQSMLVTKIGVPVAGRVPYSTFELRAGRGGRDSLSTTWTRNLSDQRLQADLSGMVLMGGETAGQPSNDWVEIELANPFVWTPGSSVVIDLITSAATPVFAMTSSHMHERLYVPFYNGQPTGTLTADSAIAFRIVFEPIAPFEFGSSCVASTGAAPALAAIGDGAIGATTTLSMTGGFGAFPTVFVVGLSRNAIPVDLGGGCALYVRFDATVGMLAAGSGAGGGSASLPLDVPNDPNLAGVAVFSQCLQFVGSPSPSPVVPLLTSNGVAIFLN